MTERPRVIEPGQIYLGGYYFKLAPGTRVDKTKAAQFPPKIVEGAYGSQDDPYRSHLIYNDHTGGVGVNVSRSTADNTRVWWGTLDMQHPRRLVLGPLAHDVAPPAADAADVAVLFEYRDDLYAFFGNLLYRWNFNTDAWDGPLRTFGAVPTAAQGVRLSADERGFDAEDVRQGVDELDPHYGMAVTSEYILIGFEEDTSVDPAVWRILAYTKNGLRTVIGDRSVPTQAGFAPTALVYRRLTAPLLGVLYTANFRDSRVRFFGEDGMEVVAQEITVRRTDVASPEAMTIHEGDEELLIAADEEIHRYSLKAGGTYGSRLGAYRVSNGHQFRGMTIIGDAVFGSAVDGLYTQLDKVAV